MKLNALTGQNLLLYYPIVILHTRPEIPRVPGTETRDVDQKERDAVTTL
jgi:hypothetical protein